MALYHQIQTHYEDSNNEEEVQEETPRENEGDNDVADEFEEVCGR